MIKRDKGITLISLSIAVIIILTITGMIIYSAKDSIYIRNLTNMQNDLSNLRDRVSLYYSEYGDIPAETEYPDISKLQLANVIGANDTGKFLIIELEYLEGLTLNYGKDYEKYKAKEYTNLTDLTDIYIINENSHNIFYVEGIRVKENDETKMYYTDSEPDKEQVKLVGEKVDIPETGGENFSRQYGTIDVIFLKGTTYLAGEANTPKIDEQNMVPVNWNAETSSWIVTDYDKWEYSYSESDKKWANVMLRDTLEVEGILNVKTATIDEMDGRKVLTEGSMLVWIPRYAYKITYYSNATNNEIVGYSDARGLVDSEGRTPEGMETPETSIAVEDNYRPHPAFEDGSDTGYKQGEWDERLEGIWVGKFETTEKVQDKITVLPNKASYRNETMNTFYNDARALNIANSHVMKNSEWGALVYLTKSKYGKNDVAGKFLEDCITGGGDYKTNISQSTTGNIYGIYDTVAGTYERTTSYIANSLVSEGNVFTSTDGTVNNKTTSTKYATVYNMASNDTKVDNYNANINKIFGDAMIETSTAGEGFETWENSFSEFSIGNTPFITRGAGYNITEVSQFYFYNNNGTPSIDAGFRLACIVK